MRVIETKAVRRHKGPGLLHVCTQNVSQDSMKDVGTRVICRDSPPSLLVDMRSNRVSDRERSMLQLNFVYDNSADWRERIDDPGRT